MSEEKAKQQLRRMLRTKTQGAILHLLAEVFREDAEEARQNNDLLAFDQAKHIEYALFVVGLGLDAASPRAR